MIPARIGSVRVKRKNLRELSDGVTLLGHAIQTARAVPEFDEVWVDTYDQELQDEAVRYGANVHVRAKALSLSGTSTAFKVEFLNFHPCDWCMVLNTTSPMLSAETASRFVRTCWGTMATVVHSVESLHAVFFFMGHPVNVSRAEHADTQDLIPLTQVVWAMTGIQRAAYLADPVHSIWPEGRTQFFEMPADETVDIDTERDLAYAQYLYAARQARGPR